MEARDRKPKRDRSDSEESSASEDDTMDAYKIMYEDMKLKVAAMEKMMFKQMKKSRKRKKRRNRKSRDTEAPEAMKTENPLPKSSINKTDPKMQLNKTKATLEQKKLGSPAKPAQDAEMEKKKAAVDLNGSAMKVDPSSVVPVDSIQKDQGATLVEEGMETETGGEAKEMTEEGKLWATVKRKPTDFDAWVRLASLVEKKDYEEFRHVLKALLKEYPLCYGYWTKLAELEKRYGHPDLQLQTCEEGVAAAPHCHEMWTYFCCVDFHAKDEEIVKETRRRFERAAKAIGNDFQAHGFWNKYLEYETQLEDYPRVAAIYQHILSTPLAMLDEYYKRYETFASSRPLSDLLSPAESKRFDPKSVAESETYRKKVMADQEEIYLKTKEIKSTMDFFENKISRAYFHVKDVDSSDLTNWHAYLDHLEATTKTDPSFRPATLKVYERCLIACAAYPEFWLRYARFAAGGEAADSMVREIYERTTGAHTKRQPEVYLDYALFEEAAGRTDHARQLYQQVLTSVAPGLIEGVIAYANFERRAGGAGGAAAATKAYQKGLEEAKGEALASLTIHAADFYHHTLHNTAEARALFQAAASGGAAGSLALWLAYADLEDTLPDMKYDTVAAVYEQALATASEEEGKTEVLSSVDQETLAMHYLDFAKSRGASAKLVRKLLVRFPKADLRMSTNMKSTKTAEKESAPVASKQQSQAQASAAYATGQVANAAAAIATVGAQAQAQAAGGYNQAQGQDYYAQQGYGYYQGYDAQTAQAYDYNSQAAAWQAQQAQYQQTTPQ